MNKLNIEGPINSLSLGNVTLNFLRELVMENVPFDLFPVGEKAEFTSYDQLDPTIRESIIVSANNRLVNFDINNPGLKIWHLNGSQFRISKDQYLYTFYETDSPTPQEVGIVKSQKHVFFSSSEATRLFAEAGCDNVSYIPLGFDSDLEAAPENKLRETIHFGLIGKFEKRKNTAKIIKCWTELYGNKLGYQLTLLVNNPFLSDDHFNALMSEALNNKHWSNVNILPRLQTNTEVGALHKSIDIDLSGLSGGEGWNLPPFSSTCMGKWAVVSNCSSHKDWANSDNSILVEPSGKEPCYDGIFFNEGLPFNQGSFYTISEESIKDGIERAVNKYKETPENINGRKMRDTFTYQNTMYRILEKIREDY